MKITRLALAVILSLGAITTLSTSAAVAAAPRSAPCDFFFICC